MFLTSVFVQLLCQTKEEFSILVFSFVLEGKIKLVTLLYFLFS